MKRKKQLKSSADHPYWGLRFGWIILYSGPHSDSLACLSCFCKERVFGLLLLPLHLLFTRSECRATISIYTHCAGPFLVRVRWGNCVLPKKKRISMTLSSSTRWMIEKCKNTSKDRNNNGCWNVRRHRQGTVPYSTGHNREYLITVSAFFPVGFQ